MASNDNVMANIDVSLATVNFLLKKDDKDKIQLLSKYSVKNVIQILKYIKKMYPDKITNNQIQLYTDSVKLLQILKKSNSDNQLSQFFKIRSKQHKNRVLTITFQVLIKNQYNKLSNDQKKQVNSIINNTRKSSQKPQIPNTLKTPKTKKSSLWPFSGVLWPFSGCTRSNVSRVNTPRAITSGRSPKRI